MIEDEGQFDGADDMDAVRNLVDGAGDDRVVVVALGDLEMEMQVFFRVFSCYVVPLPRGTPPPSPHLFVCSGSGVPGILSRLHISKQ